jgi:hypothetical protein
MMAERRMISQKIVETDWFVEMSISARLLYYELNWRADDDGFVSSPKQVMKMSGCTDGDMQSLISRRFVIPFESGVVLIKDWKIHNYIKKDRYHETIYLAEKSSIVVKPDGTYEICKPNMNDMDTKCIQSGYEMDTEVRLGKVSLGKDRLGEFENVLLTQEELDKLIAKYGESISYKKIDDLSNYLMSTGKKYKSHYATILTWCRKDKVPEKAKTPPEPQQEVQPLPVFTEEQERMYKEAMRGNINYDYTTGNS